ncbi:MAG: hypothetical protein ACP5E4_04455, partial [Candidatus Aenigmatarchaeota archaeon]
MSNIICESEGGNGNGGNTGNLYTSLVESGGNTFYIRVLDSKRGWETLRRVEVYLVIPYANGGKPGFAVQKQLKGFSGPVSTKFSGMSPEGYLSELA